MEAKWVADLPQLVLLLSLVHKTGIDDVSSTGDEIYLRSKCSDQGASQRLSTPRLHLKLFPRIRVSNKAAKISQ